MDQSTPGPPVFHGLPELGQSHVGHFHVGVSVTHVSKTCVSSNTPDLLHDFIGSFKKLTLGAVMVLLFFPNWGVVKLPQGIVQLPIHAPRAKLGCTLA